MRGDRYPRYGLPYRTFAQLLFAALGGAKNDNVRSFHEDARSFVACLRPPLQVDGREHVPQRGPCVLTINHYARPGFQAGWLAVAVSAVVPVEAHWIMTDAWTYPDPLRQHVVTPTTRWFFRRLARVYGFTAMPPMPPDPRDTIARAAAVRSVLSYARRTKEPVIAFAPEGADSPDGTLMTVVGIFALLSALPGGWLADRLGPKRLVAGSGLLAVLGTALLLASIWAPSMALIYTAGCTLGLAAGLFMTTNWALGTGLVPREEAGRYLGISNLAGAGAGMIGSGIGGPVADLLNNNVPGLGYFVVLAGHGVLFLSSAITLRGVPQAKKG